MHGIIIVLVETRLLDITLLILPIGHQLFLASGKMQIRKHLYDLLPFSKHESPKIGERHPGISMDLLKEAFPRTFRVSLSTVFQADCMSTCFSRDLSSLPAGKCLRRQIFFIKMP